jgi:hypothetical protein
MAKLLKLLAHALLVVGLPSGDVAEPQYEDGERHPLPLRPQDEPTDFANEADWMGYDPHIQEILAKTRVA